MKQMMDWLEWCWRFLSDVEANRDTPHVRLHRAYAAGQVTTLEMQRRLLVLTDQKRLS